MNEANKTFCDIQEFVAHLRSLREERLVKKTSTCTPENKRRSLSIKQRKEVFEKTGGRCHICGGIIESNWVADHVLAHAQGGEHSTENYLPAHAICNRSRWFYGTEEFQWILKLGVWLRTQTEETGDADALRLCEKFIKHEAHRESRQKITKKSML